MNACIANQYFSGQGALLLATRDVAGMPLGFRPVGNVSALTVGVETTTYEHKESCTGVRGIDLEIVQEINATLTFTMESLDRANLALALYGTSSLVATGTVSDETVIGYTGLWSSFANINVNTVVVTDVGAATTYTEGTDYELNLSSGSLMVLSGGAITDAQSLEVDYAYTDQDDVQGITSGTPPERWARFEGLNTADNSKPLVIDFYRASMQPLSELALITDEISQMEVEAKVLADSLRVTGSQYMRIRKVM